MWKGPALERRAAARRDRRAAALALAAVCAALLTGCAARRPVQPQILNGAFTGETADGQPVVVTFSERLEAFQGTGTIGGRPLVLAGAVGWRGVGSLATGDGPAELVALSLAADGETLVLERQGQPAVTLHRGVGAAPEGREGPFSGTYRAQRDRAVLAEITLVQRDGLIAGIGTVAGDPAGVTGHTVGPDAAAGVVTFLDGTQAEFRAELAPDGESMTVHGFGEPIAMRRGGG